MADGFAGRDLISIRDVTRRDVEEVLGLAEEMSKRTRLDIAYDKLATLFFFEPSTRTRLSFEAAMYRLGGHCLSIHDVRSTSLEKGESLSDTFKILDSYGDVLLIRHSDPNVVRLAAEVADNPVINAGAGRDEHPTQALIDAYIIRRSLGRLDGLTFCILGDLKYSRAARSLLLLLDKFKAKVYLVSPPELEMDASLIAGIENAPVKKGALSDVIGEIDVLYVTRVQKERFPTPEEYEAVKGSYKITLDSLRGCKADMIVIHPLPRVDELGKDVDSTPHARYFQQAALGISLRMALLALTLGLDARIG
ncbi:MAG: aspartate carbamoyltransferase [Candidatus Brockarchaeota archaeon]|nr:aspartate carbamoyltransferase [Candidatus Brockarchaeota archaeon]